MRSFSNLFFCPLTRRLWNFSSIYLNVMNSLSSLFFIHEQEGYETFHSPTWVLWDHFQTFFLSLNKKITKLFIHLHEFLWGHFQTFFHSLTRKLWNFSSTLHECYGVAFKPPNRWRLCLVTSILSSGKYRPLTGIIRTQHVLGFLLKALGLGPQNTSAPLKN
jgi:hypothetical protein